MPCAHRVHTAIVLNESEDTFTLKIPYRTVFASQCWNYSSLFAHPHDTMHDTRLYEAPRGLCAVHVHVHVVYYVQLYMRMYTTICTCTCSTSVVAGPQVLKHEGRRHRRCFRFRAPQQVQYAHSTHKWHVATAAREREGSRESADYLTAEIAHRSGGATP